MEEKTLEHYTKINPTQEQSERANKLDSLVIMQKRHIR